MEGKAGKEKPPFWTVKKGKREEGDKRRNYRDEDPDTGFEA